MEENTQFNGDNSDYDLVNTQVPEKGSKNKTKSGASHIAAVAGAAVAGGAVGAAAAGAATMHAAETSNTEAGVPEDGSAANAAKPDEVLLVNDEGIKFAHVDANNFTDAFAQARAQVGPGGAFEFQGKVYGTYYADEWSHMSHAEQEAFQHKVAGAMTGHQPLVNIVTHAPQEIHIYEDPHVHVHHVHDHVNHVQHHHDHVTHVQHHHEHVTHVQHHHDVTAHVVEHVEVVPSETVEIVHHVPAVDNVLVVEPVDSEIRVLGVETVHTDMGDMNVAAVSVGDDPGLLVDINNDHVYDVAVHDDNYNNQIEPNEIHDISDAHIHVEDMQAAAMCQDTGICDDFSQFDTPDVCTDIDLMSI